jgi:hypothetical protein
MNSSERHASRQTGLAPSRVAITGLLVCLLAGNQPVAALEPQAQATLGRLFMSPEERRALDAGRVPWRDADDPETSVAPAPSRLMLNGVLRRSSGPAVVFINGQPAGGKDAAVQVARGPDRQNTVTVLETADGRSIRLKPGQSWTP